MTVQFYVLQTRRGLFLGDALCGWGETKTRSLNRARKFSTARSATAARKDTSNPDQWHVACVEIA